MGSHRCEATDFQAVDSSAQASRKLVSCEATAPEPTSDVFCESASCNPPPKKKMQGSNTVLVVGVGTKRILWFK